MRNTKTLLDYMAEDCWTIRIPKPRITRSTVRWSAALALSLGFNVGFVLDAHGAEPDDRVQLTDHAPSAECDDYAALHYEMSGGDDAAWEAAIALCNDRIGTEAQAIYWAMQCEETGWSTTVEVDGLEMVQAHCGDADGNEVF